MVSEFNNSLAQARNYYLQLQEFQPVAQWGLIENSSMSDFYSYYCLMLAHRQIAQ